VGVNVKIRGVDKESWKLAEVGTHIGKEARDDRKRAYESEGAHITNDVCTEHSVSR
jgi:hypothetical protein